MSTLVYKYGLLSPIEHADTVREQIRAGHHYRNALVAIERTRRQTSRAAEASYGGVAEARKAYDAAKAVLDDALSTLKKSRSSTRTRSDTPTMRDAVNVARVLVKDARKAWQTARADSRESAALVTARKEAFAVCATQTREARAINSLYWGTGALVDDAVKAASKTPLYAFGEPSDPAFKRWQGEGAVGIQVHQKGPNKAGIPVADLLSGAGDARSWLELGAQAPRARPLARSAKIEAARARNAARREAALTAGGGDCRERRTLRIRVGTADDRTPIMAAFPVTMHRELPTNGIVKRAAVHVRRVGPREEWTCSLTVSTPDEVVMPEGNGTVAIEVGWKSTLDGVRVATWLDDSGRAGHLLLDDVEPVDGKGGGTLGALRRADTLQGTRDQNFNVALGALVEWLRTNGMPTWMRKLTVRRDAKCPSEKQALAFLSSWRSPARLASLCRRWQEEDGSTFAALEAWRYHDLHLWAWESSQRAKSVRRRREIYRVFAATMTSTYATIIVSNADYRELSARPKAEGNAVNDVAAANRKLAAPGSLRETLALAAKRRGVTLQKVSAAGLSTSCPSCGALDQAHRDLTNHECVCMSCSYRRDIDTTACLNMLRSAGHGTSVEVMIMRGRELGNSIRQRSTRVGAKHDEAAE